jgi:hypothetical protein
MTVKPRPATWIPLAALALMGVCLALWFLAGAAARVGKWGIFPLDDSYIHLRLADNWLHGRGFVINPGESATPESSALWGALLCLAGLARIPLPFAAMALGVIAYLALGPLAWLILRRLTRDRVLAFLGAAAVLTTGRLVWAAGSGMEITLAAALGLTLIWFDLRWPRRRFSWLVGATGGLATLARPELALLVAVIAVTRSGGIRRVGPWLEAALAAAIFATYPLHLAWHTGSWLPPTLIGRMALFDQTRGEFVRYQLWALVRSGNIVVALLLIPALWAVIARPRVRRAPALWLWPAAQFAFALALFHVSYHHSRYLMPIVPPLIIAVTAALPRLVRWWKRVDESTSQRVNPLARVLAGLILLGAVAALPLWHRTYELNVSNIHDQQITIARWINANVPPGALLAVNDIGAYTYFTDRPVVDVAGLATPSLLPALRRGPVRSGAADPALAKEIARRGCQYAVLFPAWYPVLTARTDLLQPVREFTLRSNTICGDNRVAIYRVTPSGVAARLR